MHLLKNDWKSQLYWLASQNIMNCSDLPNVRSQLF